MKKISTINVVLGALLIAGFITGFAIGMAGEGPEDHKHERRPYVVIRTFMAMESAGYRMGSEERPHVVVFDSTSAKNKDLYCSFDEYANISAGDTVVMDRCVIHANCWPWRLNLEKQ